MVGELFGRVLRKDSSDSDRNRNSNIDFISGIERNINNIEQRIEQIEQEISNNYKFIPPIDLEKMKIDLSNLKIQKCKLKIDALQYSQTNQIDSLEIEKQRLMIQYYNLNIRQSQIRINS